MKTCIVTTDSYLNHDTGEGHPEKPDRVTVVIDNLQKLQPKNLLWMQPKKFDYTYLELAHDTNYLHQINDSFPNYGLTFSSCSPIVSPASNKATLYPTVSFLTALD